MFQDPSEHKSKLFADFSSYSSYRQVKTFPILLLAMSVVCSKLSEFIQEIIVEVFCFQLLRFDPTSNAATCSRTYSKATLFKRNEITQQYRPAFKRGEPRRSNKLFQEEPTIDETLKILLGHSHTFFTIFKLGHYIFV